MRQITGIQMELPEGKLPGYYAQIIKGIAAAAELVDREKDLLFAEDTDVNAVLQVLLHYGVDSETAPWLLLEDKQWSFSRNWEDYGIKTKLSNALLDLTLTAVLTLHPIDAESELASAELQLEEHLIASLRKKSCRLIAIDRQLIPLAEGIAGAYRCKVSLIY